ncbi:hypothetical protein Back11_33000 [Paenibacillus baekrokdamisoli]|uniref:Uncharacterized protein n=1 Tax=Paenibacillus baekrokdamisoli TaxID=1712516 RepID=A0A3G9J0S0_9BACL|nr:hypothetical protein [Paenibacillus baekrokdamisoli]MBB3071532.1 hypothetical protein [Paenibacillus baekrokdamisoli]BBH21955.1 hypothetical protein Back11_33000 [Paenibacillus baekrokdamisoli]
MAKSLARKRMEKKLQRGSMDPRLLRGNWNGVKPVMKVKPNKRKFMLPKNDDDRVFKQTA